MAVTMTPRYFVMRLLSVGKNICRPNCSRMFADGSATDPEPNSTFAIRHPGGKRMTSQEFVKSAMLAIGVEGEQLTSDQKLRLFDACDILHKEYDVLLDENDSLLDRYKRALAESENMRKRSARQVEEIKTFAVQGFCKDLLEVADILNLALESMEVKHKEDNSLKNLHEGISMTKDVLLKVFNKHGLVQVIPEGQKFDPNYHEAVFEMPPEKPHHKPGHVAQVLNIGYSLHNRPIRPAKVGVVKHS